MITAGQKVLVVEDEASIRKFIAINLNRSGFHVLECESGEEALQMMEEHEPTVAILDVMLPGMDGFELCRRLRQRMPQAVIIMLTAKGMDMDKIMGLELGADDYMVKPFNPLELVARINANLRKLAIYQEPEQEKDKNQIRFQILRMDLKAQRFYRGDEEIELTPTEFALMKVLMEEPEKAFSRDEILNLIWGENYYRDMKTVDVHIRRIREKLEANPSSPQWVETVWGHGYRLRRAKAYEKH